MLLGPHAAQRLKHRAELPPPHSWLPPHLPARYPQGGVEHDGPQKIVVHPLVLLHAVDHYNRVAKDTKKRVVGILLGETRNGVIEATSSYALPFEEDERDPSIWFLDHSYHEEMYKMCRKVNVREKLVGWYTTGPKIRAGDLQVRPRCPALRSGPGAWREPHALPRTSAHRLTGWSGGTRRSR